MRTEFFVDVLDASGVKVGDGALQNIVRLSDTRKLDSIGGAMFEMPAADSRAALITAGRQFDLYDRVDGYIGRYSYKSKTVRDHNGIATLKVELYDALRELSRTSVKFRRTYTSTDVASVVSALVALASGWISTVDSSIGDTSIVFEGESILIGIDALRDRWNKHYRLTGTRTLEFGAFGASSGIVFTNLRGQFQSDFNEATKIAIVEDIELVEESDEVFNLVIPLGAGQGTSQLTIQGATSGSYTVQTGTNADASSYYYIQDATSIAVYGTREKVLTFPQIAPITNSDANLTNARNALKLAAEAYIARHLIPKVVYAITIRGLREDLTVGDTVRLRYRGTVSGYTYIDVDGDFYVMDVTRSRTVDGERVAIVNIASIAERRTADTDIMLEVVNDLRALKIHVPITLAYSPIGPYIQRVNTTNDALFTVRIGNEVTLLNYAKLRFKTGTLKSSVSTVQNGGSSTPTTTSGGSSTPTSSSGGGQTTSSGGSSTPTSSGGGGHSHLVNVYSGGPVGKIVYISSGAQFNTDTNYGVDTSTTSTHDHTVTIGAHTHTVNDHTHSVTIAGHTHDVTIPAHNHSLTYGLYADTVYPGGVSVEIDGIDRTVALGGGTAGWGGTASSFETELDITTYLNNAAGGLRQNHTINFACASGQGEIEFECDMLCSIQAITVT